MPERSSVSTIGWIVGVAASLAVLGAWGCNLYYDVDEFAPPSSPNDVGADTEADADASQDVCQGESDEELLSSCDDNGVECGEIFVTDRCEVERSVDCGDCQQGEECQDNQCVCAPETNDEFCSEVDDDPCGIVEGQDRCGEERVVDCGECSDEAGCNANQCVPCGVDCTDKCGLVPDGCGEFVDCSSDGEGGEDCDEGQGIYCHDFQCQSGECEPLESCEDEGAECGQIPDGCGGILDCESGCSDDEVCSLDNECVCDPESDETLCEEAEDGPLECGNIEAVDRCGLQRSVDCGSCEGGDVCDNHQCRPPECVGRDLDTDFEHCGQCGNECAIDETCVDGDCQSFSCADQGTSSSSSCDPVSADCDSGDYCRMMVGQPDIETEPDSILFACNNDESVGSAGRGEQCPTGSECEAGLYCIDWENGDGLRCIEPCRRDGHDGCSGADEYCANPSVIDESEPIEDQKRMDEFGFCSRRCSPNDGDACPGGRRCTADPGFPDGTCQPNFRCINNGGSSGKTEGSPCNRASLASDGCPSGLRCFPAGDDGQDICVRACQDDDDCPEGSCDNADEPWQAKRYCQSD